MSKIAERVILNRLNIQFEGNNLTIPEEFGFRAHHNTRHLLLRVVESASAGLQTQTPSDDIFLDVQKTFDKITHLGLIFKVIMLEMPDHIVLMSHSYLSGRSVIVCVERALSHHFNITTGVQQGSLLGPRLFSCYVNDIPRHPNTSVAQYAEDTTIVDSDRSPNLFALHLQHHLQLLEP